jgi:hypothetical protein
VNVSSITYRDEEAFQCSERNNDSFVRPLITSFETTGHTAYQLLMTLMAKVALQLAAAKQTKQLAIASDTDIFLCCLWNISV